LLQTTKYDGEGVFVYYEQNQEAFAFNSPSGRVRIGFPALAELQKELQKKGVRKALLRAELYLPIPKDSKRPGISEVIRVSFNGTEAEVAQFKLAMLDIIMLDGKDLRPNLENFQETWKLLEQYFGTDTRRAYHRAEGVVVPENQVQKTFDEQVAQGHEGLVLRRLNRLELIKIKPHLTVDAAVVGYVEGEIEGQIGVTSLLTALTYPQPKNGDLLLQTFARVGSGMSDQQRVEFLDTFAPLKIDSPISMTDSDGRTVSFVKPRHILEVEGDDLVLTSGAERQNHTQLFSWNAKQLSFLGLTPCPRLSFAVFSRMRMDKDLASGGARLEQIIPEPRIPQLNETVRQKPNILRREVYIKAEAVRKLVVVKQTGENVIPYLVYWTDYSAKRKEPLKVSTAFAYTETRANALAQQYITENVTKGFVLKT
jgi:hypothetical protein